MNLIFVYTPSFAWREGLTMSETLEPLPTEVDQRQLAERPLAEATSKQSNWAALNGVRTS